MLRQIHIVFAHSLLFFCSLALASPQEVELRRMIESDMAGNPTIRIELAAPNAKAQDIAGNSVQDDWLRRGAFDLDADPLEIAIKWHLMEKPVSCNSRQCTLEVVFRVVATTKGDGNPSWMEPTRGREIVPLAKPVQRVVRYKFARYGKEWKLINLPVPYVSPEALLKFFKDEIKQTEAIHFPATTDEEVLRNRALIRAWTLRQIEVLEKLPH